MHELREVGQHGMQICTSYLSKVADALRAFDEILQLVHKTVLVLGDKVGGLSVNEGAQERETTTSHLFHATTPPLPPRCRDREYLQEVFISDTTFGSDFLQAWRVSGDE